MKTAPVFLFVERSPIFQSDLHQWLQTTLNDPRILVAGNVVEALRRDRVV